MNAPVRISAARRRELLIHRHLLDGSGDGPEAVMAALVVLHATDPASVWLSVLARSARTTLGAVSAALYDRGSLVRWMAMRRTLFVLRTEDVAMIQAAAGAEVAGRLARQLVTRMTRNGCDPPVSGDVTAWLADLRAEVERTLERLGSATGVELARAVPALGTVIAPRTASEQPQRLTTPLLTLLGAEGRIVRGQPTGGWTNRVHRWEPVSARWPEGVPVRDVASAQQELAGRWLARFGPARESDLAWWSGWNLRTTRRALAGLSLAEVDLDGQPGICLAADLEMLAGTEPAAGAVDLDGRGGAGPEAGIATLLPALDPTPMGYTHREWFLGMDPAELFDRSGNIGPTLWWNGEVIGGWAMTPQGELRTAIRVDRGADARAGVDAAAAALAPRLEGAVLTPAAGTPLERRLSGR